MKGFTEKTYVSSPDPHVFHTLQTGRYPYSHPSSSSKTSYTTKRPPVHCPLVTKCPASPVMYFPTEVWLHIFWFLQFTLEPDRGTAVAVCHPWPVAYLTLAKTSRVSKRFHAMAVPFLYHTVPGAFYSFVRSHLARTLLECPHLAQLVQEAHIKVEHVRDSDLPDALEAALEECPEHMTPFFSISPGQIQTTGVQRRRPRCLLPAHAAEPTSGRAGG